MFRKSVLLVTLFLFFNNTMGIAQNQLVKKFMELHAPEKWWIIMHPFSAKKAWKITAEARQVTAEIKNDPDLDGDDNGGQVDAFRHAFWMASLAQEISVRSARRLGKAHEKGNKIDYERLKTEEGMIPDLPATQMDLKNNEVGLEIGKSYPTATRPELITLVKQAALAGKLVKIKKDKSGNDLDWQGNPIPYSEWHGKWVNTKCLVASDYKSEF